MPDQMTKQKDTSPINEKDVAQYLRDNPDFLTKNPELCDYLQTPKSTLGKGIADFQHYMVERLRADKDAALKTQNEIVAIARANMNNLARIHAATLVLLEARNFGEFIENITMDLASILDVDIAALIVESNGKDIPHVHQSGVRVVPQGTINKWMGTKEALLEGHIRGIEEIWGGGAGLVASQALLRVDISMDTPPAILAFGSRNPDMFDPTQGTELISYLARVVERCFRSWLQLPL